MSSKSASIEVIKQLRAAGFEAVLAGGCVRDLLLGRTANDYDVATSASPREVIRLFGRTIKIGAHFGVVVVLLKGQQVEVATFRSEGSYEDGRHPNQVQFSGAQEDALRRDFTINGMFYDPLKKEVIDYVGGQQDLSNKVIRTIGKPEERFGEDYLRMLRAVRFSTQLDFAIEPQSWSAIGAYAKNITRISGERIAMELESILVDPNRSLGAAKLIKSGLAEAIFPGFADKQAKFAIKVLAHLRQKVDFPLALAAFFADFTVNFAGEKCVILMLSREQNRHIKFLLKNRGKLLDEEMSLAELRKIAVEPYFEDLYELQKAIQTAKSDSRKSTAPLTALRERLKALGDTELKPKPFLDGNDLIGLGAVPGPQVGQLAEEMYIAQLEGLLQNTEQARLWVQKWLQRHGLSEK